LEIKEIEAHLQLEIKAMDTKLLQRISEVEVKIAEVRADLIRWFVDVGFKQSSLIVAVFLKVRHIISTLDIQAVGSPRARGLFVTRNSQK
jgi:hypothetical protein